MPVPVLRSVLQKFQRAVGCLIQGQRRGKRPCMAGAIILQRETGTHSSSA